MVWLGVTYHDTITLGSVIFGVVIGLPGLFGLLYGARQKANAQVAEESATVAMQGRAAFKDAAERLGSEKDELQAEIGRLNGLVSELEKRPQFDDMLKMLERMDAAAAERTKLAMAELIEIEEKAEARTAGAFAQHEKRAQERHEISMKVAREMLAEIKRERSK